MVIGYLLSGIVFNDSYCGFNILNFVGDTLFFKSLMQTVQFLSEFMR